MFGLQMGAFRRLDEAQLAKLDESELVAYAVEAREAGLDGEARAALRIFAFGMEDALRAFVRIRLDTHGESVIDEIAERALADAIRSIPTLRGRTAAEARAFVFKIARLRIADYLRSGRIEEAPLEGPTGDAGLAPEDSLHVEPETDAIDTALLLEEALTALRPDHRAVVELFVLQGYSARETVERLSGRFDGEFDDSMSEQNVHQIGSRFRKDLRSRLEAAERVSRP
jgi:DNA-directed RNA polymerase specialized sigma24 family protein